MRRTFARQVKRCRFNAYLRPNRTLVRLISNSISSSSCPGGEGMQFQPSPRGHHLLAYNSSRIYILNLQGPAIEVVRELKVLRRPAATCIRDDASVLAVLLTEMQVDLYDLKRSPPRRIRSIILDNSPRAIALSPCGSILAAAYEGGIEVSSLNLDALSTDRRAVKCDHVDALAFSFDGTQLLGTSVQGAQPNTVILTAPYYDPGSVMSSDDLSALWTTSILFPNTSRDCSHAVLLQDSSREEAFWTFTYDRSFETFRAVRIDDLRNGTTYFTGPVPASNSHARLLPCTLPSASYHGDLVSAAFQGKEIWLYGVPEDLDDVSASGHGAMAELDAGPGSGLGSALNGAHAGASSGASANGGSMSRANSGSPSMRAASARLQDSGNDSSVRVPQWQLLCDRLQNTFIAGCRIGELPGVGMVNWVEGFGASSLRERLVVGARGVSEPKPVTFDEDDMDFIDGGRLLLVDFDYGVTDGKTTEVTIEVGSKEPEVLEEEHRDLDAEVAIVRRRTVAQKKSKTGALMRNAAAAGVGPPPAPSSMAPASLSRQPHPPFASSSLRNNAAASDDDDDDDPLVPRRIAAHPASMLARNQAGMPTPGSLPPLPESSRTTGGDASNEDDDGGETESILEEQMAYDAPYSHASPRSGMTLRRAATAAAVNRRLNPPPATTSSGAPIAYRRADGRREHPHESDADNWVPPPPPYQAEVDPQDLPAFLRHNVPPVLAPLSPTTAVTAATPAALPSAPAVPRAPASLSALTIPGVGATLGQPGLSGQPDDSVDRMPVSAPGSRANSRPTSRQSETDDRLAADIYEATPPATPQPAAVPQPNSQQAQEVSPLLSAQPTQPVPLGNPGQPRPSTALPSPTSNLDDFAGFNMNWGDFMLPSASASTQQPPHDRSHSTFVPKPMSSVQTWPVRQPSVSGRGPVMSRPSDPSSPAGPSLAITGFAVPTSGYPYSAPVHLDQRSGPIPPGPLRAGIPAPVARPPGSSGSQTGPTSFSVPRVPVGSYRPNKRASMGQPVPNNNKPLFMPQMNAGPFPAQQIQHVPDPALFDFQQLQQPQPYFFQNQPPPRAFSNPVVSSSSPLVEDQPLIISTPRGVTGAFDPPCRKKSARGGYGHNSSRSLDDMDMEEPTILAPIPRHANRHERNAELRERLEVISGGGTPSAPAPKPMMNPFAGPYTPLSQQVQVQTQAQQALNRKQSRAERSAAKNMADAKKRGWGRSGGKDKGKKDKGKSVDDGMATTVGSSSWMPSSGMFVPTTASSEATAVPAKKGRRGVSVAAPSTTASTSGLPPLKNKLKLGKMKKRKDRDVDAASSVWTDVTATTGMPGFNQKNQNQKIQNGYPSSQSQQYFGMPSIPGGGPGSSSAYAMQQLQQHMQQHGQSQHPLQQSQQAPQMEAQQQMHGQAHGQTHGQAHDPSDKKNGKCVLM